MAHTDRIEAMLARQRTRFGTSVTYRRVTPGALTATTSKRAETTADTTVLATRRSVAADHLGAGGDLRPVVECEFIILASDLAFTPVARDRIIDGSDTWAIVEVSFESDRRAIVLRCRK